MPNPSVSPVTERPRACPYSVYVRQQQARLSSCRASAKDCNANGWRQMVIGFTCAGLVGLVMLVLGTLFIAGTVSRQQPIAVMFCVMGIVFGIIILVGTFLLGKVLISRRWQRCHTAPGPPASHWCHHTAAPHSSQCLHTCSIVYSPSLDQLGATEAMLDPPPAYSTVFSQPPVGPDGSPNITCAVITPGVSPMSPSQQGDHPTVTMVLPPKYDAVTKPLPSYTEGETSSKVVEVKDDIGFKAELPPYKEDPDSDDTT